LNFKYLLIFIFILTSIVFIPFSVSATESEGLELVKVYWGVGESRIEVSAGDNGVPLTLVIRNMNSYPVTNLSGKLYLNGPFRGLDGGRVVEIYYEGIVQPSYTFKLTFYLNILDSAVHGSYNLFLSLDFSKIIHGSYFSSEASLSFNVDLRGKSDLRLSLDRNLLSAGLVNDLILQISNVGDADILSMSIDLSVSNPYVLVNPHSNHFNLLPANSSINLPLSIYVPNSAQGSFGILTVHIQYLSIYGFISKISKTLSFSSPFSFKSDVNIDLSVNTYFIRAESYEDIVNFTITNNCNFDLDFLRLTFTFPSNVILLGRDNVIALSGLASGESVTVPLNIHVPAELAGSNIQCAVELYFRSAKGFEYSMSRKIGFTVIGLPELEVISLTMSPREVVVGGTLTVSGAVRNEGISTARKVQVYTSGGENLFSEDYSSSIYLGSLSSTSQAPFSVSVRIKDSVSPGVYNFNLVVEYSDGWGKSYSTSFPLTVKVVSPTSVQSSSGAQGGFSYLLNWGTIIRISVGFLIGMLVMFLYGRRSRATLGVKDEV